MISSVKLYLSTELHNTNGRKIITKCSYSATIAQEYDKFWVGVESTPVQIVQRGAVIPPSNGISTTRRPVAPTVPVYVPEIQAKVNFFSLFSFRMLFVFGFSN